MDRPLSPQTQAFLSEMVSTGLFPTAEAALEAAVVALREKIAGLPLVPDAHLTRVEQALESAAAGRSQLLTDDDWDRLRQRLRAATTASES